MPQGKIHEFTMDSKDSKIYPGIARSQPGAVVPYTRQVAVYVPAVRRRHAGAIHRRAGRHVRTLPRQSAADPRQSHSREARAADRRRHGAQRRRRRLRQSTRAGCDTVSGVYTDFIETEVLPRITRDYGIVFTKDPEGRATMGGSSGAACAFTMAWFHPELYRKVLSYSGTYVNQQSPLNPASPRGAWRCPRDAHSQHSRQADPHLDARE